MSNTVAWRDLYAAAKTEIDPKKVRRLCARARAAIHERELQLAQNSVRRDRDRHSYRDRSQRQRDDRERAELEEALRCLFILEHST